jgi:hypothetical protein
LIGYWILENVNALEGKLFGFSLCFGVKTEMRWRPAGGSIAFNSDHDCILFAAVMLPFV